MKLYTSTFFCDQSPITHIEVDDKDTCGWPVTLKVVSKDFGVGTGLAIFMKSRADLFYFIESINQAYNKSLEAKDA